MKYDDNNVFAKIIKKEIPANIVYEDSEVIAFKDIDPKAPVHILVISKHSKAQNFQEFIDLESEENVAKFMKKVAKIATENTLEYRLITNTGELAGQSVFHFHVHILGGRRFDILV
jgi:histidine triad (HIT) family protein